MKSHWGGLAYRLSSVLNEAVAIQKIGNSVHRRIGTRASPVSHARSRVGFMPRRSRPSGGWRIARMRS